MLLVSLVFLLSASAVFFALPGKAAAALASTTHATTSGGSSADGGDLTTSSFTPSNNSLLVAVYGGVREADAAADTTADISGGGLMWTRQAGTNQSNSGWRSWITIWTAPVTTGISMPVSATNDNQMNGTFLAVYEYTGSDTGDPIGGIAAQTRVGTQGSWTFDLDASPTATSEVVAALAINNWVDAEGGAVTPGTGWSEFTDFPDVGAEARGEVQARGNSTSAAVLWNEADCNVGDSNGSCSGVAIEIKVAQDDAPTLSISEPDGIGDTVTLGDSYNITYTLADSDDTVTAAFYYDTDNSGLNGVAITSACATAAEGTDATCAWDTTGTTPGLYYVYGTADDGTNPAVSAYSPGRIAIGVLPPARTLLKPPNNLGLTGYWSFNEGAGMVAGDFSGNGNHGTLTNGPTWTNGKRGQALDFDADSDNCVTTTSSLEATLGGTASLAAWMRTTQAGDDDVWQAPGITGAEESGGQNDVFWGWIDDVGLIGIQAGNGDAAKSTAPINDGVWHYVVFTRNATTGTVSVYVDGELHDSATSETGNKTMPFSCIGAFEDNGDAIDYFQGILDDVRIYSRVLTAGEIARLYSSGAVKINASSADFDAGSSLESGLIGHWTFDGKDTQSNITDRSGQGNHGGFFGGATSSAKVIGKLGQALRFDGTDDHVNVGAVGSVGSIAFWLRPDDTTSREVINVDGSAKIEVDGSSQVTATNLTSPTVYIDGVAASTIDDDWHHVVVTTGTAINAATFQIGQAGASFYDGRLDDVRLYDRALSPAEVQQLYTLGTVRIRAEQ
jgi:concanavalin A-like lectin/glucanase superfamily protein